MAKVVGKRVARIFFMRAGGFLGRLIPWAGWGLTAYDMYDNRESLKEYGNTIKTVNEEYKNNPDGSWNPGWVK